MVEQKPYDAILVHGYWMSENRSGLSLRSWLSARAAALAWRENGEKGKIVLDLGHLWGANYPSEGKLLRKELTSHYDIPEESIIWKEEGYSTFGETRTLKELAQENSWDNILDVAFEKHHWTIPELYKNTSFDVKFKSVEEIIGETDNKHVVRLVERLSASYFEFFYSVYEGLKFLRMRLPGFDYNNFEEANKKARTNKGRLFILPIDVYKI